MKSLRSSCLLATLVTCIVHSSVNASEWRTWVHVARHLDLVPNEYSVTAIAPRGVSFTAPDGTTLDLDQHTVTGLTLSEVISRFSGQWTITDAEKFSMPVEGVPQRHFFSLSESQLTSDFPAFAEILTPADGATVPSVFEMTWAGEAILNARGPLTGEYLSANAGRLTVKFAPGVQQQPIDLLVTTIDRRDLGLATSELLNSRNRFLMELWHESESASRTVNVVIPEPASACLALVGIAAYYSYCHRK